MKTILITGAEGFIGSHVVEHFVQQGYQVRAFTWYNSWSSHGWLDTLPKDIQQSIELFPGDIRDQERVMNAAQGQEVIIHLAALITIPYSYLAASSYLETNTHGTLNILQAARKHNCEHAIITSTSEVYGTAMFIPIDENHPLQAQSPYSATKIGAEKMAEAFYKSYQCPVTIVRPFNNYGPRQSVRGLIPSLILQLLHHQENIQLGDLRPTRDWIYVTDTARALESILLTEDTIGNTYNISTGVEISVEKLAHLLINKIYPKAQITSDSQRIRPETSEVWRLCGDHSLITQTTGWKPNISLEMGLDKTILWFKNQLDIGNFRDYSFKI